MYIIKYVYANPSVRMLRLRWAHKLIEAWLYLLLTFTKYPTPISSFSSSVVFSYYNYLKQPSFKKLKLVSRWMQLYRTLWYKQAGSCTSVTSVNQRRKGNLKLHTKLNWRLQATSIWMFTQIYIQMKNIQMCLDDSTNKGRPEVYKLIHTGELP